MSSLDFNHLDSFNQGGLKTRLTKKQKIVIAVAAVLVIALAVLLCVKGCGGSSADGSPICLRRGCKHTRFKRSRTHNET